MLLYSNQSFWRVILETKGSLVIDPKNISIGVFISLVTWIISYFRTSSQVMEWYRFISPVNNVGWNMMGATIVFAVVFRTNLGWQRYWEALGQLQMMYSKWADSFTQCLGFINVTLTQLQSSGRDESDEHILFLKDKLGNLQKNFSLLSALAAHRLLHADVYRMDKRADLASWGDQVILRSKLRIDRDLTGATILPGFVKVVTRSQLNSNLDNTWSGDYCVTEVPNEEETQVMEETTDRVHTVMYWILHDLAEMAPKLNTPPPIQSRMYQELSNGMLAFHQAVKVADTPFPFQFAQLFNYLIIAFSFFIPIYASTFTESTFLSPVIAYVAHQSILIINQVAMQLETPFGTEYNDISIKDFHARFLESIIEVNPASKYKARDALMQIEVVKSRSLAAVPAKAERKTTRRPTNVVETLGVRDRSLEYAPESNPGLPKAWSGLSLLNSILQEVRDLDARGNLGNLMRVPQGSADSPTHSLPQGTSTSSPRSCHENLGHMPSRGSEENTEYMSTMNLEDFRLTVGPDSETLSLNAASMRPQWSALEQTRRETAHETYL